MLGEFDLIERFFAGPSGPSVVRAEAGVALGIGDDAALLTPTVGQSLVVTSDMLVAGQHFFPDVAPEALGHKTLAVNLSDLAAMGARPRWAILAVALPEVDAAWLAAFARGFFALAERSGVSLVGGDTTRGSLNLCVTLLGEVPAGEALRRDAAKVGDDIWVSGDLGGAALAVKQRRGEVDLGADAAACLQRLDWPEPRLALGAALRGVAHAALDISDGLLADLGHIVQRSRVGADIALAAIPVVPVLARWPDFFADCALAGGDDYELCFTAPPGRANAVRAAGALAGVTVTRIGRITAMPGVRLLDATGRKQLLPARGGFDHFAREFVGKEDDA